MEGAGFVLPTDGVGLRHRLGNAAEESVIQGGLVATVTSVRGRRGVFDAPRLRSRSTSVRW